MFFTLCSMSCFILLDVHSLSNLHPCHTVHTCISHYVLYAIFIYFYHFYIIHFSLTLYFLICISSAIFISSHNISLNFLWEAQTVYTCTSCHIVQFTQIYTSFSLDCYSVKVIIIWLSYHKQDDTIYTPVGLNWNPLYG